MSYRPKYNRWVRRVQALGGFTNATDEQFDKRYKQLKRDGFLPFEWFWLAQHDITSEGMMVMREDRRFMKEWALSEGIPYWEYYRMIQNYYEENSWLFADGRYNPFAQLDWYKRGYGITDSPEPRRKVRKTKDFGAGVKTTREREGR